MTDKASEDLPSLLTALLRNVDGVHTVYATRPVVPTLIVEVVELVKNKPVGVHLVTVTETDGGLAVDTCIGVSSDESAPEIARRAHDALRQFFVDRGDAEPESITVKIGRIG